MVTAKSKLAIGRRIVCKRMPYLTTAVYAMAPVPVPGLMEKAGGGTAITETMAFLYDPRVIEEDWDDEDVATGIYHEVGHLMRDHIGRGKRYGIDPRSRDAFIWNIAGDVCINDDGKSAGFKLLSEDSTSDKLQLEHNKSVEYNYEQLKKRKQPNQDKQGQQGQGQGQQGQGPKGRGCCGSGAGHTFDGEGQTLPGNHPAHRPSADVERTRRAVAEAVRDYATKGRGTIPGGWVRWSDMSLKPAKVPWQTKFARCGRDKLATKMGEVDYVYSGVSHLQGGIGFGPGKPILPVLRAPELEVIVVVDTSGSMGKSEIETCGGEAVSIMQSTGSNVVIVACDCQVHAWTECRNIADVIGVIGKGGGGTSFCPAFDEIKHRRKKPDLVIFMTDGGGDAPLNPPPYDVIWMLVGQHRCQPSFGGWGAKCEPWGAMIEVDDFDKEEK